MYLYLPRFSFSLVGMTGFHVYLIATGQTTREQIKGQNRWVYPDSPTPPSYDKGVLENFRIALCRPQITEYDSSDILRKEYNIII